MLRRPALLAAFGFVIAAAGCADALADTKADTKKKPPAVGESAPDFELKVLGGKEVKLSELRKAGPVAVVFLRGYPGYQCPLCDTQVAGLVKKADPFKAAGGKVVLIYPGPAADLDAKAKEFAKKKELPEHFLFVTDPDYKAVTAYNLRWDAPNKTAYPSAFVVNKDGKVRFAKVSKGHGDRAKADDLVKAVKDAK